MALSSFLKLAHRMIIKGGDGGLGKISFTKQTRSGLKRPDGGNGGNGGDVILRKSSLFADFDHLPDVIEGTNGNVGKYGGSRGANGTDKTLLLPHNALVLNHGDIEVTQFPMIIRGGRGLAGNYSSLKPNVKTAINFGEKYELHLKIEKYVDFAFIGPPNAGKTTLTNLLCNTSFKTSFVPGNTEKPNIGALRNFATKISQISDREVTIGDFPGGFDVAYLALFKHALSISRGIVIVSDDPSLQTHTGLVDALHKLSAELSTKVVALVKTKVDRKPDYVNTMAVYSKDMNIPIFPVSAISGEGIVPLLSHLNKTQNWNYSPCTLKGNMDT